MSIYTRKGDEGQTHLASGERVWKHNRRVALYGEADELNSAIGVAIAALPAESSNLAAELQSQQHLLFELGSELAGFRGAESSTILADDVVQLEQWIDAMSGQMSPMRAFILPGGHAAAAALHVARTVCRRLERNMVETLSAAARDEEGREIVSAMALRYINRLSDYLFIAARFANHSAGVEDIAWSSRAREMLRERKAAPNKEAQS